MVPLNLVADSWLTKVTTKSRVECTLHWFHIIYFRGHRVTQNDNLIIQMTITLRMCIFGPPVGKAEIYFGGPRLFLVYASFLFSIIRIKSCFPNIYLLYQHVLEMIRIYGDIFEKVVLLQPLPFCHKQDDFSVFPPNGVLDTF